MNRTLVAGLLGLAFAAPAAAKTYQIDAAHSSVEFRIRHLVGKTAGRFDKFEGSFDFTPGKPQDWKATATIDAASINTANAKRDDHLRNEDFFDVAKCPKLEFKSKKASLGKDGKGKLEGELTMHCVTKPVKLDLEITGPTKDPWGGERVGVTATGKVNRKDWGISYNKVLDAGGLMLGEDVQFQLEIEGIHKAEENAEAKK